MHQPLSNEPITAPKDPARVGLYIDGCSVDTADWVEVKDPAEPARTVGWAPLASAQQRDDAVAAAHAAWRSWSALNSAARAAALKDALAALSTDWDERVELLVRENGKVRAEVEVELGVFMGGASSPVSSQARSTSSPNCRRSSRDPSRQYGDGQASAHRAALLDPCVAFAGGAATPRRAESRQTGVTKPSRR